MRHFRYHTLGYRKIFGCTISSGVRVEEWKEGVWLYVNQFPDLPSAKSYCRGHSFLDASETWPDVEKILNLPR